MEMSITDDKNDLGTFVVTEPSTAQAASSPRNLTTQYSPEKDMPPPYSSGSSHTPTSQPVASLQKCNYLEITRKNISVKGSWLVDTDLDPPDSLLSPLENRENRPNLLLSSTGPVDARVELCGDDSKEHASLIMESRVYGSVTCRLTNTHNQMIDLRCSSQTGRVIVYIHRGFRGPIKVINPNGNITYSPDVSRTLTTFSERDGAHSCFLGPFDGYNGDTGRWQGDKLHAETQNGSVTISYLDEEKFSYPKEDLSSESSLQRGGTVGTETKGLWSRLFNTS